MKFRTILLLYICLFTFGIIQGQPTKYIYYMDSAFQSVGPNNAFYKGEGIRENELFLLNCYDIKTHKLVMSMHFKDSSLRELHGLYSSFYVNDKLESQGSYNNGLENGTWQKWDLQGMKTDSLIYNNGLLFTTSSFYYNENGWLEYSTIRDRMKDTFESIKYNSEGAVLHKNITKASEGKVFTKTEISAEFPGGNIGWINYIKQNLNASIPIMHNAPKGTYTIIIRFIVKIDGTIDDIKSETKFGYGMEAEAERLIRSGPNWIPALQNGYQVNAYRSQPITFVVE